MPAGADDFSSLQSGKDTQIKGLQDEKAELERQVADLSKANAELQQVPALLTAPA